MDSTRLQTPGFHDDFGGYIREAWRRRHFAWGLARGRVEDTIGNSRLGRVWLVIDPLLMVGIYSFVFGVGLRGSRGNPNFPLWLLCGQITFRSLQRVTKSGSGALIKNQSLLNSYAFPRIVVLMAEAFRGLLNSAPSFTLLLLASLLFKQWPSYRWLAIPPILTFAFAFAFGLGGILARWTYLLPDIDQLVSAFFRMLFFASFVFFSAETFLERGGNVGRQFYELLPLINPFYCFITLVRWVIVNDGGDQLGTVVLSATVWTVSLTAIGTWYFYRGELSYSAARIYKRKQ